MGKINNFFSFLFINSKINTVNCELEHELKFHDEDNYKQLSNLLAEGVKAKSIYKKQIRRYLGFGFFLSFIPGTDAFRSRNALLNVIMTAEAVELDLMDEATILSFPLNIFWFAVRALFDPCEKIVLKENLYTQDLKNLNLLNPFLYVIFFLVFLSARLVELVDKMELEFIGLYFDSLFSFSEPLAYFLGAVSYLIAFIVFIPPSILILAVFLLFLITEFLLSSLHTLLIEPFKFAYEVIQQLVETWDFEFSYLPTEDANKLIYLIEAVQDVRLSEKNQFIQTYELALIINSVKVNNTLKTHQNSFFFEQNKDKNLFRKNNPDILRKYNEFKNLRTFFDAMQIYMLNVFPKDLTKQIFAFCLTLDFPEPKRLIETNSWEKSSQEEWELPAEIRVEI